ncbi:MAG: ARMT1-like domain-containing protein [Saprospiraceae bacterium]|nr:ARMT1-like domain-containing protein [Saprospiraceae bacterium]
MKTYLDCIPCFILQTLRTARLTTKDEEKIKELLDSVGSLIKDFSLENTPPHMGDKIYKEIRIITGVNDPYKKTKESNIQEALSLYPELKEIVRKSENPLLTAIRLAIAGNVIDFGIQKEFNIVNDVKKILKQDFAIVDFDAFVKNLAEAKSILYLGDNAGESVFDKILIEELGKPVTYVVREIPVINDVTMQDAIDSGLNEVAEIISSGSTAPAVIPELCNDDFMYRFNNADMIISKGQGNYEGLSNVNRSMFFLLKAKCHIIAKDLNVKENDIILKGINL